MLHVHYHMTFLVKCHITDKQNRILDYKKYLLVN